MIDNERKELLLEAYRNGVDSRWREQVARLLGGESELSLQDILRNCVHNRIRVEIRIDNDYLMVFMANGKLAFDSRHFFRSGEVIDDRILEVVSGVYNQVTRKR